MFNKQHHSDSCLLVREHLHIAFYCLISCRFEEAGHYLATFKQFEFKPPDLIKERIDRDHYTILRTALTTISKVNKTDVETLRTSFNVCHVKQMPFQRQLIYIKSFANVSKVTTDQLQSLPGFGQVKVKNIKNAFEKPFRNQTTASLFISQTRKSGARESSQAEVVHNDQPTGHVSRESSPIWNIELDEGELPSDN
jgi:DNA excision repair protein ERCC-1